MTTAAPSLKRKRSTEANEVFCSNCGYLPAQQFYPGNVRFQKAVCKSCCVARAQERHEKRTVLERLRKNVRIRLNKAGMSDAAKAFSSDDVHDILECAGIKVRRSTRSVDWQYQHVHLFPPRDPADLKDPAKWTVVILDAYFPKGKKGT